MKIDEKIINIIEKCVQYLRCKKPKNAAWEKLINTNRSFVPNEQRTQSLFTTFAPINIVSH